MNPWATLLSALCTSAHVAQRSRGASRRQRETIAPRSGTIASSRSSKSASEITSSTRSTACSVASGDVDAKSRSRVTSS